MQEKLLLNKKKIATIYVTTLPFLNLCVLRSVALLRLGATSLAPAAPMSDPFDHITKLPANYEFRLVFKSMSFLNINQIIRAMDNLI